VAVALLAGFALCDARVAWSSPQQSNLFQPDNATVFGAVRHLKHPGQKKRPAPQAAAATPDSADPSDAEVEAALQAAAAADVSPPVDAASIDDSAPVDVSVDAASDSTVALNAADAGVDSDSGNTSADETSAGLQPTNEVKVGIIGSQAPEQPQQVQQTESTTVDADDNVDIPAATTMSSTGALRGSKAGGSDMDSQAEGLAENVSQAMAKKKFADMQALQLDEQAEKYHRAALEEQRKIEDGAVRAAREAAHKAANAEIKKAEALRQQAVKVEKEAKADRAAAQAEMNRAVMDARAVARSAADQTSNH